MARAARSSTRATTRGDPTRAPRRTTGHDELSLCETNGYENAVRPHPFQPRHAPTLNRRHSCRRWRVPPSRSGSCTTWARSTTCARSGSRRTSTACRRPRRRRRPTRRRPGRRPRRRPRRPSRRRRPRAAAALSVHLHRLGRHVRLLRPARAAREQRNLCALTPQTSAPQHTARAHAAPRATPTVRRRGRRRGQRLERVRVGVCENASRTTHAHAKPKKLTRVFASARAQKKAPTTATARTAATGPATGTPSRARTWCRCR